MASIVTNRIVWILILLSMMIPLSGCAKPRVINGVMTIEIGSQSFDLDIVADDDSRNLGLGGRREMDPDKGMIFSFTDSKIRNFVMRDCYIDIDIIFLDAAGRITAMHHMPTEEQKTDTETQYAYENRLRRYSSRYNAQYAIELLGGTLEKLDLEDGQQIKFDTDYLLSITQ